jgi:hypothetical protein
MSKRRATASAEFADIRRVQADVRSTPDSGHQSRATSCLLWANRRHHLYLFNDSVGQRQNLRWQIEAERFRSLKIDHEFKLRYSHHWQIGRLFAL